jgi:hypothetical protein
LFLIKQLHEKIDQQQKQYISSRRKEDQAYRYDDDVSLFYQEGLALLRKVSERARSVVELMHAHSLMMLDLCCCSIVAKSSIVLRAAIGQVFGIQCRSSQIATPFY